jgi:putative hydrolase
MTREEVLSKYRMTQDLHTHTIYSHGVIYAHGKGTILENAAAASRQGITELAITDHGPGHKFYGMKMAKLPMMREDIAKAAEAFPDVKVYLGVEANTIDTPNGLDITKEEFKEFDFVIAGYHFGLPKGHMTGNWIYSHTGRVVGSTSHLKAMNTDIILRALYENDLRILTHPGDKGPFDIDAISMACEETDTLMEINTRHNHLTVDEIKIAMKYDVSFIISSDAHKPETVGNFPDGVIRAYDAGLEIGRIVNIVKRQQ